MNGITEALDKLQEERVRVGAAAPPTPSVVFMTPSIDHCVTLGFLRSYVETIALLSQNGISTSFQSFGGDPYLSKVRNLLVSVCLKRFPTATDLFFLDADLEWDAAAVLRSVLSPEPIVAGIYCKKTDKPDFPCDLIADKDTGKLLEKDGLLKASMVPTGFLRVKRHVYVKMAEGASRYRDGTGANEECWNIFEMGFSSEKEAETGFGEWWGEDYAWCRKVQAMGYEIWVDPAATFGHRGAKAWRYPFGEAVEAYREGKATVIETPAAPPPVATVEPAAAEGSPSPEAAAPALQAAD